MRFLIDTNIAIKLEPGVEGLTEVDARAALGIQQLINSGSHQLLTHPATRVDFDRDTDDERRTRTRGLVQDRYPQIERPPSPDPDLIELLGNPDYGTNDWVDHQLIAAVVGGAADYVITEDVALRRKVQRIADAGVVPANFALSIPEAVELLRSLYDLPSPAPPAVVSSPLWSLDAEDPIWASFVQDYAEFEGWFDRVKREERRRAWSVEGEEGRLAAVCLSKPEDPGEQCGHRSLKVSSLKVGEAARGSKLGELMLRSVVEHAADNGYECVYVTVFDRHSDLIALLDDFGFAELDATTARGERVLHKALDPALLDGPEALGALEYHTLLGPPALHPRQPSVYFVPIQPRYHNLLFPGDSAAGEQLGLDLDASTLTRPFSNAIKKAYLSHAPIRSLEPGDTLLFYRSSDEQAITSVGVLEASVVSSDANEIAAFVGPRTVYSIAEIEAMVAHGEVLAMLFRRDRALDPPIYLPELISEGALMAAPQSVASTRDEGRQWLIDQILA